MFSAVYPFPPIKKHKLIKKKHRYNMHRHVRNKHGDKSSFWQMIDEMADLQGMPSYMDYEESWIPTGCVRYSFELKGDTLLEQTKLGQAKKVKLLQLLKEEKINVISSKVHLVKWHRSRKVDYMKVVVIIRVF
jgi:hypothetical protein